MRWMGVPLATLLVCIWLPLARAQVTTISAELRPELCRYRKGHEIGSIGQGEKFIVEEQKTVFVCALRTEPKVRWTLQSLSSLREYSPP